MGNDKFSLGLFVVDDGGDWGCMWRCGLSTQQGPSRNDKNSGLQGDVSCIYHGSVGVNYIAEPEEYSAILANERYDHPAYVAQLVFVIGIE